MANNPVFDPEKALGSGLGKLTRDELLSLVKSLCSLSERKNIGWEYPYRGLRLSILV